MNFTFSNVQAHINTVYVLLTIDDQPKTPLQWKELSEPSLRLKGEMIYVPESDLMLFCGSPSVLNLEELTRYFRRHQSAFPANYTGSRTAPPNLGFLDSVAAMLRDWNDAAPPFDSAGLKATSLRIMPHDIAIESFFCS